MSTRKYFAIITDVGQSKIAEAVAGGQKLNITTFLVGDGNGEYYVPTSDMTAIKNEVWRGTISKADVVQDAQKILRITTVIPAEVSGFIVREIALLDETGELIAIGNTPDLPKVRLEDGASTELKLTMRLAVKNTEALSFTIDPHTVIMTKDMLDTHNVDDNAHNELFEGKADKTGNIATATKLQTARTIRTNLASTSTASFDGTANVTPGVTGTLPIANGGTGNTTGNAATATKLQTARTISLSNDVTGSITFDGSANKSITATLKNSGVTAGTYGVDLKKLAVATWISNNRGLHSTTATSTWAAKQNCSVSFRYTVSSESVSYDYLNITAAGTQILANTGGTATTNTLTATLQAGQTLVFNYRKDGSNNTNEDCAKISEVKVTPTGGSATTVTTANFDNYFTATNGVYAFLPLIELQKKSTSGGAGTNGFTLPCVTVDAKGRVTSATEVFIMPTESGGNIPLTVAEGGTGATTVSTALSNLGGFSSNGGTINGNVRITGAVAEGGNTTASGNYSHAEGTSATASGTCSHAEGISTTASGAYSHAEGLGAEAKGEAAHAEGYHTTAAGYQMSIGLSNTSKSGGSLVNTSNGSAFIIGNGISASYRSNCFRVQYNGATYAAGSYNTSGADYAEYFEWLDGNTKKEDRAGLFVTLDGEKIRIATPDDDYILGIVSACPSIVGNAQDDQWGNMYEKDVFGREITEEIDVPDKVIEMPDPENSERTITQVICEAHKEIVPKLNIEYDNTQKYIPRSERPEWNTIGMLGKLVTVDDGSCEVNGWCKVGKGGVATKSEKRTQFRVISRLDKNHIRVLIL